MLSKTKAGAKKHFFFKWWDFFCEICKFNFFQLFLDLFNSATLVFANRI